MISASRFSKLFVALGVAALAACAPKAKVALNFASENPRFIALLPLQTPPGLRAERAAVIRKTIESNLRNANYSLLDQAIVSRVCTGEDCPERQRLVSEFGADGLVEVGISSATKNNFLAGYVDEISGKLRFTGKNGDELLLVRHHEAESGGLLFNSGQLLQGVKSSIDNYGDAGFNLLAEKFAKAIVSQIPSPQTGASPSGSSEVAIERTDVSERAPFLYQICASGTPKSLAFLSLGRSRSNLREQEPGRYCGVYRFSPRFSSPVVELRSPFGDIVRKTVSIESPASCDLTDKLELASEKGKPEITLRCGTEMAARRSLTECLSCAIERFLVYRASTPLGPFEKVAELRMSPWIDRAFQGERPLYQLIAVSPGGVKSAPIPLPKQTQKDS
jgi:hypothetical protein